MLKQFGLGGRAAFAFSYTALFLSFLWIRPSIFDSIARTTTPFVNGIATLLFIATFGYSIYYLFSRVFRGGPTLKSPTLKSPTLKSLNAKDAEIIAHDIADPAQTQEIKEQEREEKTEEHDIKKKAEQITDLELRTVDDIRDTVDRMMKKIAECQGNFTQDDAAAISHALQKITADENILGRGLANLKKIVV